MPKYRMTNQELIILSSKCEIFLSFYVLLLELVFNSVRNGLKNEIEWVVIL